MIFGLVGMGDGPFTSVHRLQSASPQTRLVVCSSKIHPAEDLLREGVLGYLTRTDEGQGLLDAIRTVMRGERYCSPEVAEFLEQTTGPLRITPEERRVLAMLSEGVHDVLVLAERLGVHRVAVLTQLNALQNKTGCFSRRELAAWYRAHRARLTPDGTLNPIAGEEA